MENKKTISENVDASEARISEPILRFKVQCLVKFICSTAPFAYCSNVPMFQDILLILLKITLKVYVFCFVTLTHAYTKFIQLFFYLNENEIR